MASFTITEPDKQKMGAAVVTILQYARNAPKSFTLGPFTTAALTTGFTCSGDTADLLAILKARHPGIQIEAE